MWKELTHFLKFLSSLIYKKMWHKIKIFKNTLFALMWFLQIDFSAHFGKMALKKFKMASVFKFLFKNQ
jgi:hypothetical protein